MLSADNPEFVSAQKRASLMGEAIELGTLSCACSHKSLAAT